MNVWSHRTGETMPRNEDAAPEGVRTQIGMSPQRSPLISRVVRRRAERGGASGQPGQISGVHEASPAGS